VGYQIRSLEFRCVCHGGHSKEITGIAITPDNQTVVTASWDETVRRWDRNTGTCFQILRGHSGRIWSMAMTTDGQKIVTGSQDHWCQLKPKALLNKDRRMDYAMLTHHQSTINQAL
jgi:WD40 repeat protein